MNYVEMTPAQRVIAVRTMLRERELLHAQIAELLEPIADTIPQEQLARAQASWTRAGKADAAMHAALSKAGKASSNGDVTAQTGGGK